MIRAVDLFLSDQSVIRIIEIMTFSSTVKATSIAVGTGGILVA